MRQDLNRAVVIFIFSAVDTVESVNFFKREAVVFRKKIVYDVLVFFIEKRASGIYPSSADFELFCGVFDDFSLRNGKFSDAFFVLIQEHVGVLFERPQTRTRRVAKHEIERILPFVFNNASVGLNCLYVGSMHPVFVLLNERDSVRI